VTTRTSVATTVDSRTVAELHAAVIAGDASITAEQLASTRSRAVCAVSGTHRRG
jgi:hypothetical protein